MSRPLALCIAASLGSNEFTVPDSAGKAAKLAGRRITVWRKGPDGHWRCVEDYSTPAPAVPTPTQ